MFKKGPKRTNSHANFVQKRDRTLKGPLEGGEAIPAYRRTQGGEGGGRKEYKKKIPHREKGESISNKEHGLEKNGKGEAARNEGGGVPET